MKLDPSSAAAWLVIALGVGLALIFFASIWIELKDPQFYERQIERMKGYRQ